MSKNITRAAALVAVASGLAVPSMAQAGPVSHSMHVNCYVRRGAPTRRALRMLAAGRSTQAICRSAGRARADNEVTENCGSSWIYDNSAPGIGVGWIQELYGFKTIAPIVGGGTNTRWYNFTTTKYRNSFSQVVTPPKNGYQWTSAHNVYSHKGWIGSWFYARVVVASGAIGNAICSNGNKEPYSYTWASS